MTTNAPSCGRSPGNTAIALMLLEAIVALILTMSASPAWADCLVPTNLGQSASMTLTDRTSSMQLFDGAVIPFTGGDQHVDWHQVGTAYGYCDVYSPDCQNFLFRANRTVAYLMADIAQRTTQCAIG